VLNEISALKPILEEHFRQIAEKEIAENEDRRRAMQKPESSPRPPPSQVQQTYVPYENWNLAEQLKDLPSNQFISNDSYVKIFLLVFIKLLNPKISYFF
jgi:hypothetical protein